MTVESATAHGLLWLFLDDFFHQILFYFGTVVAMGILLLEKRTNKPIQWRWTSSFFLLCVFVSCFQVWADEHRNSEQLIKDKSNAISEREFWKEQSYAKDETIRQRDGLLSRNYTVLADSQRAFNGLTAKILDVTKPEPLKLLSFVLNRARKNDQTNVGTYLHEILLLSNKTVTPVRLIVTCDRPVLQLAENLEIR